MSSTNLYTEKKHTSFMACAARFPALPALAVFVFVPEPRLRTGIGRFCCTIQLRCHRSNRFPHLSIYLLSCQHVWLFITGDESIAFLSLSDELATRRRVWQFAKTLTLVFFTAL
jgi:hypothetical protein